MKRRLSCRRRLQEASVVQESTKRNTRAIGKTRLAKDGLDGEYKASIGLARSQFSQYTFLEQWTVKRVKLMTADTTII